MSKKAKGDEIPCCWSSTYGKVAAMDFLDEYWFFHNIFKRTQIIQSPPTSPAIETVTEPIRQGPQFPAVPDSAVNRIARRALLRAPSLPPRMEQSAVSISSLDEEQSSPIRQHSNSSLDERQSVSSSKSTRHRKPRYIKVEGSCWRSTDYAADFRRAFQEKKWKSSSDLEGFEVQGFRDLGFVFDEAGVNPSLARVIPGLRDRRSDNGQEDEDEECSVVRRPYLSEAWVAQRSAPLALTWHGTGSAEEMKGKLRFWARAVACNVRQEC